MSAGFGESDNDVRSFDAPRILRSYLCCLIHNRSQYRRVPPHATGQTSYAGKSGEPLRLYLETKICYAFCSAFGLEIDASSSIQSLPAGWIETQPEPACPTRLH